MEMKQIKLKIYLKSKRIPIVAILPNESYIDEFYRELNSRTECVRFGKIIFRVEDLRYCTIN